MSTKIDESNRIVIDQNLYTFYGAPHFFAMKGIDRYYIEGDSSTNKFTMTERIDEDPNRFTLEKIQKPFKEKNKWGFAVRATALPIIFTLLIYFLGTISIGKFSTTNMLIVGGIYTLFTIDAINSIIKLQNFKSGLNKLVEHDFAKMAILTISMFGLGYYAISSNKFGFVELSPIVFVVMWYIIFNEGVKKPIAIIFSDNVQYWTYRVNNGITKYTAISPALKKEIS